MITLKNSLPVINLNLVFRFKVRELHSSTKEFALEAVLSTGETAVIMYNEDKAILEEMKEEYENRLRWIIDEQYK
jgi:hypothetical protein